MHILRTYIYYFVVGNYFMPNYFIHPLTCCRYGGNPEQFPDPSVDFSSFEQKLNQLNSEAVPPWCVIRNSRQSWITTSEVAAAIRP